MSELFKAVPHPRIASRKRPPTTHEILRSGNTTIGRFNSFIAVKITAAVGTMWCAYLFAALALISFPNALRSGTPALVQWIAQTFLQLVLLSIIIVGQNVQSKASDKRAEATYEDADAILHTTQQIHDHLDAQDNVIRDIAAKLNSRPRQ